MSQALTKAKLDSLETECTKGLSELHKMESIKGSVLPMPDVSVKQITKAKEDVKKNLEKLRNVKSKKIVHL
jgi:hypothetical protein